MPYISNWLAVACLALSAPGAGLAQEMIGDPAAGEELFAVKCVSCHAIENEAGEVLAGRGSRNLYGLPGRVPGSLPDVQQSEHLIRYGQTGTVWEEANFVGFVPDPSGFLREALGMPASKVPISRMPTGVIRDEQEAYDLWAYLATVSSAQAGVGGP